ncbi:MAG: adenylyl-sulfate kinase [Thermoplasmata archaeon]|jgi:adenylylsulfate kinase
MVENGFCIWMTGLPSSGKTTIGRELAAQLRERGLQVELLDGDEIRKGLSADLGFDRVSRETHAHRVAFVAKLLARNRAIPIVTLISPYRSSRARARSEIGRFVEVYISTPIEVCEQRDVKGLYRKARAGELRDMTGVDDPYEPPEQPEITVNTVGVSVVDAAKAIMKSLESSGWIRPVRKRAASASGRKPPSKGRSQNPARTEPTRAIPGEGVPQTN